MTCAFYPGAHCGCQLPEASAICVGIVMKSTHQRSPVFHVGNMVDKDTKCRPARSILMISG